MFMTTIVLIAKEPLPGKVKTRLHPALSYEQAAELAAASIDDTLATLAQLPATRRILAFDGERIPCAAAGYEVLPQSAGTLDQRLGAIFDHAEGPTILVGMDTPQVAVSDLAAAFTAWPSGLDAWFGPANDGGFWALGMARPTGDLIRGVPMSQDDTGAIQFSRLRQAGLSVGLLPRLTDVDEIADAHEVASLAPSTLFASTLARMTGVRVPELVA